MLNGSYSELKERFIASKKIGVKQNSSTAVQALAKFISEDCVDFRKVTVKGSKDSSFLREVMQYMSSEFLDYVEAEDTNFFSFLCHMAKPETQAFLLDNKHKQSEASMKTDCQIGYQTFRLIHILASGGSNFGIVPLTTFRTTSTSDRYSYIMFNIPLCLEEWYDALDPNESFAEWEKNFNDLDQKSQEMLLLHLKFSHPGKAGNARLSDYKRGYQRESLTPPGSIPGSTRGFFIRHEPSLLPLFSAAIQSKITDLKEALWILVQFSNGIGSLANGRNVFGSCARCKGIEELLCELLDYQSSIEQLAVLLTDKPRGRMALSDVPDDIRFEYSSNAAKYYLITPRLTGSGTQHGDVVASFREACILAITPEPNVSVMRGRRSQCESVGDYSWYDVYDYDVCIHQIRQVFLFVQKKIELLRHSTLVNVSDLVMGFKQVVSGFRCRTEARSAQLWSVVMDECSREIRLRKNVRVTQATLAWRTFMEEENGGTIKKNKTSYIKGNLLDHFRLMKETFQQIKRDQNKNIAAVDDNETELSLEEMERCLQERCPPDEIPRGSCRHWTKREEEALLNDLRRVGGFQTKEECEALANNPAYHGFFTGYHIYRKQETITTKKKMATKKTSTKKKKKKTSNKKTTTATKKRAAITTGDVSKPPAKRTRKACHFPV